MEYTSDELNLITRTLRNAYYAKAERRDTGPTNDRTWRMLTIEMLELDRLIEKIVEGRYANACALGTCNPEWDCIGHIVAAY